MTDATKLIERLRQYTGTSFVTNDLRDAAALIEQQAARIAELESAAKATVGFKVVPVEPTEEMIRTACLAQSNVQAGSYAEWHDNHSSGISERIRELVARDYRAMVATAPAATDNGGGRDEVGGAVLTPAQWADVYYFARASEIGAFVGRAQEVFDAALSQKAGEQV